MDMILEFGPVLECTCYCLLHFESLVKFLPPPPSPNSPLPPFPQFHLVGMERFILFCDIWWMDEILHNFETMGNNCLLVLGFFGWCTISSIHSSSEPLGPRPSRGRAAAEEPRPPGPSFPLFRPATGSPTPAIFFGNPSKKPRNTL